MTGIELITKERQEQIQKHGFDETNDDKLVNSQLLYLAQYILFSNDCNLPKDTWSKDYIYQLHLKPRIEQLAIAAALIAADIDRRMRLEKNKKI